MISPQSRSRLPEIVITKSLEKLSPSRPKSDRSGWTSSLYKTKPTYIAKKITTDELFGDSCKITSAVVLSQINEERANEMDEPNEPSVLGSAVEGEEENDVSEIQESRNIFQKESLVSSKYKEQGKGPVYNQTGLIIKHSIVGSSEMFERYQRNLKKGGIKDSGLMKESSSFPDKENASFSERSGSKVLRPLVSFQANDQTQMSLSALNTQNGFAPKRYSPAGEKKKEINKTVRVTKEDLFIKIDQMRQTQGRFYEDEAIKYKYEPLSDQLFHSKEQRCLEKFDKSLVQWNNTLDVMNRKINRNVGKSVMAGSEAFREKIEEAEAFNLAQTSQERFGSTFWYMSLRNYGGESTPGTQRVIHDIPDGFNSPQVYRPVTSMEIVKKPSKLSKTSTLLPSLSSSSLHLDRTKREYIEEKSALLKSELKKIKPVDNLMIEDIMVDWLLKSILFIK